MQLLHNTGLSVCIGRNICERTIFPFVDLCALCG